jgi:integrase
VTGSTGSATTFGRGRIAATAEAAATGRGSVASPEAERHQGERERVRANDRHDPSYASLLIVGAKLDPVALAAQLGHSNPATTLRLYAHLFDKARHADEVRDKLEAGFGRLLNASS